MRFVGSLLCALGLAWASPELRAQAPKLALHPEKIELVGTNARHGVLVTLVQPDGTRKDVTSKAKLVPSNANVRVEGSDAFAAADGACEVRVEVEGQSATLPITVRESG